MFFAYLLKPFILLAVLALIIPIRMGLQKYMKDGKLKRFLLLRV